jgi:hypothetical protein
MTSAERATAFRDHYAVLGVDVDSGDAEIKVAFWELAKRHHPDVNPGGVRAARRFAEISEAKTVLLSRSRRAAFDRERDAFLRSGVAVPVASPVPEPAAPPRHAAPGRALLLTGGATVVLAVLLLPLATLPARLEPIPVRAFDAGVLGGAACCAGCLLVGALSWPGWRGALSAARWEALLAALVLWLGLGLAGQVDPHVLLGGLFSSDVSGATGADVLLVGIALMLGGTLLLRPPPRRRTGDGQAAASADAPQHHQRPRRHRQPAPGDELP